MDDNNNWFGIDKTAHIFTRTSLFSVSNSEAHKKVKGQKLVCPDGFEIEYTGERLSQYDRDVSLALKKLALKCTDRPIVQFRATDVFRTFKYKKYGKSDVILLHNSLKRMLIDSTFCFSQKDGLSFEGPNANYFHYDEKTKVFSTIMNEKWIDFFINNNKKSSLDMDQRMRLPRGVCRWLHGYWSSFDEIEPVHIDFLRMLSGSKEKRRANFKQTIKGCLVALEKAKFLSPGSTISKDGWVFAVKA